MQVEHSPKMHPREKARCKSWLWDVICLERKGCLGCVGMWRTFWKETRDRGAAGSLGRTWRLSKRAPTLPLVFLGLYPVKCWWSPEVSSELCGHLRVLPAYAEQLLARREPSVSSGGVHPGHSRSQILQTEGIWGPSVSWRRSGPVEAPQAWW